MKEFTKEEKRRIMENAKSILLSGNCGYMCGCIDRALGYLFNINVGNYSCLHIYFPEFNRYMAIEKFSAENYDYSYWWNDDLDGMSCRLEYFDYLIKLYSE